jgi:hypothetical protein
LAFVTLGAETLATAAVAEVFLGAASFFAITAFFGATAFFAAAGLEVTAFAAFAGAFFLAAPVFVDAEVARDHSFHGSGRLIRRPMKSL